MKIFYKRDFPGGNSLEETLPRKNFCRRNFLGRKFAARKFPGTNVSVINFLKRNISRKLSLEENSKKKLL